jgi:hypothetical protein
MLDQLKAGARRVLAGAKQLARRMLGDEQPASTFFGAYGRSIVVGASAGLLTVVIAVLLARSCGGRDPAAARNHAASDGAHDRRGSPRMKRPTVDRLPRTGSAR